jgi:hypothetical protein
VVDGFTPEADDLTIQVSTSVLSVGGGWSNVRWYVDGLVRGAGTSIDLAAYPAGGHSVLVTADRNGVPYSARTTFTVE